MRTSGQSESSQTESDSIIYNKMGLSVSKPSHPNILISSPELKTTDQALAILKAKYDSESHCNAYTITNETGNREEYRGYALSKTEKFVLMIHSISIYWRDWSHTDIYYTVIHLSSMLEMQQVYHHERQIVDGHGAVVTRTEEGFNLCWSSSSQPNILDLHKAVSSESLNQSNIQLYEPDEEEFSLKQSLHHILLIDLIHLIHQYSTCWRNSTDPAIVQSKETSQVE
jgi:hypothetical protein